jgi:hypothetical protein
MDTTMPNIAPPRWSDWLRGFMVCTCAITTGFSETGQLTQRKSQRFIEGFVCNPLLHRIIVEARIS